MIPDFPQGKAHEWEPSLRDLAEVQLSREAPPGAFQDIHGRPSNMLWLRHLDKEIGTPERPKMEACLRIVRRGDFPADIVQAAVDAAGIGVRYEHPTVPEKTP